MKKIFTILAVVAMAVVSCNKEEQIKVTSISVNPDNVTVNAESTFALSVTILPENATNKGVTWTSNNTSVATVSPDGVITGVAEGSTDIVVSAKDGGGAVNGCRVTVLKKDEPIRVVSVSLDKASLDMYLEETYTLTATINPSNATDKSVSWSSSNPAVATVSNAGVVTAMTVGKADITVTTTDGAKTATCAVTTTKRQPKRPSAGTTWTITNVATGLVLYNFYGKDTYSGKNQSVYVADIDTSYYALRLFYDGNSYKPSQVFSKTKASVLINGAYETASIFIRTDDITRKKQMQDSISGDGGSVPNWKNDGGIHVDSYGRLTFSNSIFREADNKGTGSYGLTLETQRTFYRGNASKHYGTFSSAPLLVDNYKAIGMNFVPDGVSWSSLPYEHPYRHQGNTHPRTAVASDCQGHVLLIVVDGRYTNPQRAVGFSAKQLTHFLVEHFDVRNALNMDGGGSTCMCVEGQGDPETHVVNHPCESGTWDNPGERTLSSFIWVEKRSK